MEQLPSHLNKIKSVVIYDISKLSAPVAVYSAPRHALHDTTNPARSRDHVPTLYSWWRGFWRTPKLRDRFCAAQWDFIFSTTTLFISFKTRNKNPSVWCVFNCIALSDRPLRQSPPPCFASRVEVKLSLPEINCFCTNSGQTTGSLARLQLHNQIHNVPHDTAYHAG